MHTAALGVDPYSWELVRFTLWAHPGPGRYEVLHLSSPHLDEIPRGRLW